MSISADTLHLLDFSDVVVRGRRLRTRHPGFLLAELLNELSISQTELARAIGVPPTRVSHIVKGKRPVTADVALRLGRRFRQSPQYWLNLQARYDLDRALDEMGRSALYAIEPVAA
jgi:addiction module HigA family antidote